jgi:PAS domain S-box-containing protein
MVDEPLNSTQDSPPQSDADNNTRQLSELANLRSSVEELRRQNAELMASCQKLEDDQRRYREVFDLATDGYVLTDLDGTITDANRTAAALLSVRQDFLAGKSVLLFIDEGEHAALLARIAQWRDADHARSLLPSIWRGQIQLRVYKGAPFPADFALSPLRDRLGQITGLRWLLRDLSESTRTQQALRESEYHYRTLFDNAGDAIFIHNLTGRYLEVNRVACESLGYSREELLRMTPADLNTPEMISQIPDRIARLREDDHIFFETAYVRRDGTKIGRAHV